MIALGSAVRTLLKYDLHPDAVCSYDPGEKNWKSYDVFAKQNITHVPMIYGSSIDARTVAQYPGPMLHMITSQDTIAGYYCGIDSRERMPVIQDAPSVAIMALQLFYHLRASPIILIGQNLGFRNDQYYASGTLYGMKIPEKQREQCFHVEGVLGEQVLTSPTFNSFRLEMEKYIALYRMSNVINTTQGGARINGTRYMQLDDVMNRFLQHRIVEAGWEKKRTIFYDEALSISNIERMNAEKSDCYACLREMVEILFDLEWAVLSHSEAQLMPLFAKV